MGRKFIVWHDASRETKEIVNFFVSDITEELKLHEKKLAKLEGWNKIPYMNQEITRPRVASFPVSQLYDEETQRRRAKMLADYLNKLQETMEKAESDAALIDILAAKPQP